jgi:hypothetical protein
LLPPFIFFSCLFSSCCERMKELNRQLKKMTGEMDDLGRRIAESSRGVKEQVATILSMPPPRVLYQGWRGAWPEGGATGLPLGRSTLQPPKKGRGHERKGSGDKRERRGFTSTL